MDPATHPDSTIDIDNGGNKAFKVAIYKVPWHILQGYEVDYHPKFASFGPYHRNEPRLLQSIKHKRRYLSCMLPSSITIESLNDGIRSLQLSANESYPDLSEDISSDEFIAMLVLDSFFIIQVLRLFYQRETHDPIFRTRWMVPAIRDDLLLLENQLPYSVLQKMFELTAPSHHEEASLKSLILKFFGRVDYLLQTGSGPADHILGLVHSSYTPSVAFSDSSDLKQVKVQPISALTLHQMGIGIRPKTDGNLLNLEFKYGIGILLIPHLLIDNNFIIAVRNFIAYEQCSKNVKPYFTSFAIFLDGLINSSEDVKLLCEMGIISHTLGSEEEVLNIVNSLTKNIVLDADNDYLSSLTQRLQSYIRPWNMWRGQLIRDYFRKPDSIIKMFVSFVAIYLAVIQTVFSVITFYKK
ncbi:hypothetical protein ACHQM5_028672 [Ranunculus cassubicifolius]